MRRRRGLTLALLALAAVSGAFGLLAPWEERALLPGSPLIGPARVVDGDTLVIGPERIRLHGVDAPEAAQKCQRNGQEWRCGADVTDALRDRVFGKVVSCTPLDRDRFERIVARCSVEGQDLGAWLVSEGLAVAYTEFSWRYVPEELAARWHGRGLWAGQFETPSEHRRAQR